MGDEYIYTREVDGVQMLYQLKIRNDGGQGFYCFYPVIDETKKVLSVFDSDKNLINLKNRVVGYLDSNGWIHSNWAI